MPSVSVCVHGRTTCWNMHSLTSQCLPAGLPCPERHQAEQRSQAFQDLEASLLLCCSPPIELSVNRRSTKPSRHVSGKAHKRTSVAVSPFTAHLQCNDMCVPQCVGSLMVLMVDGSVATCDVRVRFGFRLSVMLAQRCHAMLDQMQLHPQSISQSRATHLPGFIQAICR